MQAALNAASNGFKVIYMDSNNSFSLCRLRCCCEEKFQNGSISRPFQEICGRISVIPVFEASELLDRIQDLPTLAAGHEDGSGVTKVKPVLVIIDSISGILGPFIGGKKDTGNKLATHVYTAMRESMSILPVAFLTTNSMTTAERSHQDAVPLEGPVGKVHVKPALGHWWGHYGQHIRILLKPNVSDVLLRSKGVSYFSAEILKGSPRLVPASYGCAACFCVGDRGVYSDFGMT